MATSIGQLACIYGISSTWISLFPKAISSVRLLNLSILPSFSPLLGPTTATSVNPSVDPVVLFKTLLIGYLHGITSERRLIAQVTLAYRSFPGYDLDEAIPDHSVLPIVLCFPVAVLSTSFLFLFLLTEKVLAAPNYFAHFFNDTSSPLSSEHVCYDDNMTMSTVKRNLWCLTLHLEIAYGICLAALCESQQRIANGIIN